MAHTSKYLSGLLAWVFSAHTLTAQTSSIHTITLDQEQIVGNNIYKKIPLQSGHTPIVHIQNIATTPAAATSGTAQNSFEPDVVVVTERKKHFAILKIPVFVTQQGQVKKLQSIDIQIDEIDGDNTRQRTNFVANSVLSSGNWYKIAVPKRGVFKIDYAMLSSMGINPAQINAAHIRLYGNGGKMMSEKVGDTDNYDDLVENAIFVSASGASFGNDDYILFYADGPEKWTYEASLDKFNHSNNIYEEESYYFINVDIGPGKRIGAINNLSQPTTLTVNDFDNYWVSDVDSFTPSSLGRIWWDKRFNSNNSSSLVQSVSANLYAPKGSVYYETRIGHNSANEGNFSLNINGGNANGVRLYAIRDYYTYFEDEILSAEVPFTPTMNFEYRYIPSGNGVGFMDYLLLNYKSHLNYNNQQLNFRNKDAANLGLNQYVKYELGNASDAIVWDVTDMFHPVKMDGTVSAGTFQFQALGNEMKEFVAFNMTTIGTPRVVGPVANQNLHALGYADLIIITHPNFITQAETFAAYKRSQFGQQVTVVNVEEIYNEFSSGSKDISAIRNFIKMFYDRANSEDEIPDGVLFYGNASYDFKDRIPNNTNFVPSYQSPASGRNPEAFTSDDFFGILDDGEDMNVTSSLIGTNATMLDIAIGRLPINTPEEANVLLDKYKNYHSSASFGPWKNTVAYVADDRDPNNGMNHLNDCEQANDKILTDYRVNNLYKIYADAYRKQQTSSGTRFPQVNKAINDQIFNGTLYLSYSGHGSPERWADESILSSNDFNRWNNIDKLPFIFTGTCDFSRFDNPLVNAAGVQLLKRKTGGAIALLSTTQIVYSSANTNYSKHVVDNLFTTDVDGNYRTIGEVVRISKNQTQSSFEIRNNFNYSLLGDPTMYLGIPKLQVKTDEIKNITTGQAITTDTLSALGRYEINGHIADKNGNELSNFNGTVFITIFDKPVILQTIPSDRNPTPQYKAQNNTLTKISGTVTNGKFSVPFIVPKDILFDYGLGKISYYAHSDQDEAKGFDTTFTIGGFDPNAEAEDNDAPIVKAYIDDDKFKNGSIVGANPRLYATFSDDNGINISGSSLGHDLVAILDGDESAPYVMNSYYDTELNDFTKGHLYFPFYNLPEGKHTIKVRAWDVYNNSGEGEVTFEVKNPDKGFIGEIYSYPNPFSTTTNIVVQHNQEGKSLHFRIRIFDPSGRMVGYTEKEILADGNRTIIPWDGTTLNGQQLKQGLYFYNVEITTEDGKSASANQKLVYLPQ